MKSEVGTDHGKREVKGPKKNSILESVDSVITTMYNEPSVGLYFTQQHIHNNFPLILHHLDSLADNHKKLEVIQPSIDQTIKEMDELSSLTGDFSFKMLTKIQSLLYKVESSKSKK